MAQSFSQLFTGLATRNEKETMQLLESVQQNVMQLQQIKQQKRDKYANVVAQYDPDIIRDFVDDDPELIDKYLSGNYDSLQMANLENYASERTEVRNAYRNFKTQADPLVLKNLGLEEDYEPKSPDGYDDLVEKYKSQAVKSEIISKIYTIPDPDVRKNLEKQAAEMEITEESVNEMMANINAEIDKLNDKEALKKAVEELSAKVTPEIYKKFNIGNIKTKERFIEVMQELNLMEAEAKAAEDAEKEIAKATGPERTKTDRDNIAYLRELGIDTGDMNNVERKNLVSKVNKLMSKQGKFEAIKKEIENRAGNDPNLSVDFKTNTMTSEKSTLWSRLGLADRKKLTSGLQRFIEARYDKSTADEFMEYLQLIEKNPELKKTKFDEYEVKEL
jgi:hypothetical protein